MGAPNAEGQHQKVRSKPFCGSVIAPGRGAPGSPEPRGRCPGQSTSPAPWAEGRRGLGAGRRQRMLVVAPSGTARMLRARLAALPSPAAPPGSGDAASSQNITGQRIFPRGAHGAPGPAGTAHCSFPAWFGPSPCPGWLRPAPNCASSRFGKLLAPIPRATRPMAQQCQPSVASLGSLLGPAQAGAAPLHQRSRARHHVQ